MTHHVRRLLSIPILLACTAALPSLATAQGTPTSTLSGIVVDSSDSPIPGANVVVRNTATGGQFTAVSDERGTFSIPALDPGTYSVTIAIAGFK